MPTIENHTEHAFHLPPRSKPIVGRDADGKEVKDGALMSSPVVFQEAILFARAGQPDEAGNPIPSLTKVSAETLKYMQEHPIAKSWLKPLGGKLQLRVAENDEIPEGAVVSDQSKKSSLASAGGNQGAEISKSEGSKTEKKG